MHDYSKQMGKYAIITYENAYAIVAVDTRSILDKSEVEVKPGTLSVSKSLTRLQSDLDTWYKRENNPMTTGLQLWKAAKEKQERKRVSK